MKQRGIITTVAVFSLAVFTLLTVSKNRHEDYRILDTAETQAVYGGSSSGGGGGWFKDPPSAPPTPQLTNITLSNVPYVSQRNAQGNPNSRDEMYCGIASSLMVRAKGPIGSASPTIMELAIDIDKKTIDNNLQNGIYGEQIDVTEYGLLYVSKKGESNNVQFDKTAAVLQKLYTAQKTIENGDQVFCDNGHVLGINVKVYEAANNSATDVIFNHIKNTQQPAIIIIDSNIQAAVEHNNFNPFDQRSNPTLHYNVVIGVEERNNQENLFRVYDPILGMREIPYTATQLMYLMRLQGTPVSSYKPYWVYEYPYNAFTITDPCYVGLVQGD